MLWPPDAKNQETGKVPDAGSDWSRRRERQRMRWLDGITVQWTRTWANSRRRWRTEEPACCSPRGLRVRHDLAAAQEQREDSETQKSTREVWRQIGKTPTSQGVPRLAGHPGSQETGMGKGGASFSAFHRKQRCWWRPAFSEGFLNSGRIDPYHFKPSVCGT